MPKRKLPALLCGLLASAGAAQPPPSAGLHSRVESPPGVTVGSASAPARLVARVVKRFPHATDAFTEGLVFHEGQLYESTGKQSSLRRLSLEKAAPAWMERIGGTFAEGLASDGKQLYQLTWKDGKLFTWAGSPPRRQRTLGYSGEGWGLCYLNGKLIRSDGSPTLHLHEPSDFREVGQLRVTYKGKPLSWLNELECVDGAIYANLWVRSIPEVKTSDIAQIDPASGAVVALIDGSELVREVRRTVSDPDASFNGIAIEPATGRTFVTGKNWPTLFEVKFEPAPTASAPASPR